MDQKITITLSLAFQAANFSANPPKATNVV
jgi:hypothetical protein